MSVPVREHYDSHLSRIYLWMAGGFERAIELGAEDLRTLEIDASTCAEAIDLGAGFGMHSIPLARAGCRVMVIDTSAQLLEELGRRAGTLPVFPICTDLLDFSGHVDHQVPLILCMGDTLTHLETTDDVLCLFREVAAKLVRGGRFAATFRNYEHAAQGVSRFIPVRNDEERILTCFLEADGPRMLVHDILHERQGSTWTTQVSCYAKLRLTPDWVVENLRRAGLDAVASQGPRGMTAVMATNR